MSTSPPSRWVSKHLELLQPGSRVLDLACGDGRHTRLLHARGHNVVAVDRNLRGIADLSDTPGIELRELELEGDSWPLTGERFAGVVVVNYLYRPFLSELIDNLSDDGVLIYATFAAGNEKFGRPRNPDFLLQPDELAQTFGNRLHVVACEQTTEPPPAAAVRQRLSAVAPGHPAAVR